MSKNVTDFCHIKNKELTMKNTHLCIFSQSDLPCIIIGIAAMNLVILHNSAIIFCLFIRNKKFCKNLLDKGVFYVIILLRDK